MRQGKNSSRNCGFLLPGAPADTDVCGVGESPGNAESTLRSHVTRLRARYRERLREEVRRTVDTEAEVEEELRALLRVLTRG